MMNRKRVCNHLSRSATPRGSVDNTLVMIALVFTGMSWLRTRTTDKEPNCGEIETLGKHDYLALLTVALVITDDTTILVRSPSFKTSVEWV